MKKRLTGLVLSLVMIISVFQGMIVDLSAEDIEIPISKKSIKAFSSNGKEIDKAIDGDNTTFWKSALSDGEGANREDKLKSRMYDHNRYINITLDGTYDLSKIEIFNTVDSSFNNYYIYTSMDGVNFDKVVSKIDDAAATTEGDSHNISVKASYIRLNMAYNSNSFPTNLAEIKLYGNKIKDTKTEVKEIETSDWQGSTWQLEWDHFESDKAYANQKTLDEAKNLVGRIIGDEWKDKFTFQLVAPIHEEQDLFEILDGPNNTIIVRGNDGVSLASGFNYYLKNYVNVDFNPLFGSNVAMSKIEAIGTKVTKETLYDYRYALNFCTYSYTMSFWNWDEYEEFIDWAAMNGVNLMLDIVGQEDVLRQTLKEYNYTDEEIKNYISGPAYFAWFYMQNLYSFGGPLPDAWFEQRVELGRKMHDRMQTYGIDPVIQGFAGQVPETFVEKNEGAVFTPIDEWPSFTRPSIIKTYLTNEEVVAGKKNYFSEVAETFYEKQKNVFGDVSKFYAVDPFHEGGKTDGLEISDIFKEVQSEMIKSDDDAIWVMQQWQGNLNKEKISKLPRIEQTIALDLQSDMNQQNGLFEQKGMPWIYNMLHNFGGRMGLDGEIPVIATDPINTYNNKKYMRGIGITPEALENSPVIYELLFDMTWTQDPIDYQVWLEKYAERRAGGTSESLQSAWNILLETAYADKGVTFQGAAESVINSRPDDNFNSASTWGHSIIPYDKKKLDEALKLLKENYEEFKDSPAFAYDLADVSEQVLSNSAIEYHRLMVKAKNEKDVEEFKRISTQFLEIIDLSDQILSSTDEFMVGTWIEDARDMIVDADDWTKDLFEFNARALVTTWGGERSEQLKDYSNRKWAGLTKDFYKARWQIWVNNRLADLEKKEKNPADVKAEKNWFLWEWKWVNRKSDDGFAYSNIPSTTDELFTLATKAYDTYSTTALEKFISGPIEEKTNVAKGKTVTSSSKTDGAAADPGALINLTDDNSGTGWTAEGAGPHKIEVDLDGTYDLDEIVILIKQAAGEYELDYKVEVLNPDTNVWTTLKELVDQNMTSKESIAAKCVASKIRLTMSTRDLGNFPVYVTEIVAYGKEKNVIKYNNVAKNKVVTSNKVNAKPANPLTNLVDDDVASLWMTADWGTGAYPAWVNVDLGGNVTADYVELYLEKAGLPFKFNVEAVLPDGTTETIYDKYADHTGVIEESSFKIPVNKKIKSVKVNLTGITGAGAFGVAGPCLSEIKVLSKGKPIASKNVAAGKNVTSTKNNPAVGYGLEKIVDDNEATFWKTVDWGPASLPAEVEVDLGKAEEITKVELFFEKAGTAFKFKVFTAGENGVYETTPLLDRSTHSGTNEHSYTMNVNKSVTKIKVQLIESSGQGTMAGAGPAIAEIKAFANQDADEIIFTENDISGISVTGTGTNISNTLDGNEATFSNDIQDKELIFDLGNTYYINNAILTFEKAGLGLKYKVYAENNKGDRSLLIDTNESKDLLTDKNVSVNVKQAIRKIVFIHNGNNGVGTAAKADPRLYEFKVVGGFPENIADNAEVTPIEAAAIVDGSNDTSHVFNKGDVATITLDKTTDINMISIMNAKDDGQSLLFKVEAFDEETKTWVEFIDQSDNEKTRKEFYAVAMESQFTNKLRFTFLNAAVEISQIKAFEIDKSQPLVDKIKSTQSMIDSKTYLGYSGNYTLESKAKVIEVLDQAKTALDAGLHSKAVSEWIAKIDSAIYTFHKTGVIFINRGGLLAAISTASEVENALVEKGIDTNELAAARANADLVYTTKAKTQVEIDQAQEMLIRAIEKEIEKLDAVEAFALKVTLANKLVEGTLVGSANGQVSAEAKEEILKKIQELEEKVLMADGDSIIIDEAIKELEEAVKAFENIKVVVDKTELQTLIASIPPLDKAQFDKGTWVTFESALNNANVTFAKEVITQEEINEATAKLKTARAGLVKLNKEVLRSLLTDAAQKSEVLYKEEAWKTFADILAKAQLLISQESLAQTELDTVVTELGDAIKTLELNKKEELKPNPEKPVLPPVVETKPSESSKPVTPQKQVTSGGALPQLGSQAHVNNQTVTIDENKAIQKGTESQKKEVIQKGDQPLAIKSTSNNWIYMIVVTILAAALGGAFMIFKKMK